MYYENPDGVSVHMGFPNPAADASLQSIDLNKLLIKNPLSTYLMRIEGNEWRSVGISDGAILVIDRASRPRANDLVVWWQGDSFVLSPHHELPLDTAEWGMIIAAIQQFGEGV